MQKHSTHVIYCILLLVVLINTQELSDSSSLQESQVLYSYALSSSTNETTSSSGTPEEWKLKPLTIVFISFAIAVIIAPTVVTIVVVTIACIMRSVKGMYELKKSNNVVSIRQSAHNLEQKMSQMEVPDFKVRNTKQYDHI
jgi:uncharacterized membrane protein